MKSISSKGQTMVTEILNRISAACGSENQSIEKPFSELRVFVFLFLVLFSVVLPSLAFASGVSTIVVEKASQQSIIAPASAHITPIDSEGYPIPGVSKNSVTILIDDKRLKPKSVKNFARPIYVIFLVDVSGTMQGPPINKSKLFISQFVQQMNPNDRVALIAFSDSTEVLLQASPPTDVSQFLNQLVAKGKRTELYRSVIDALELANEPNVPKRKIIVVLSDGKDESKSYSSQDVIQQAKKISVPIYTVGFGKKYQKYQMNLERISSHTGGIFTEASIYQNFSDVGSLVHQQVMGQIIVEWKRNFKVTNEKSVSIEIKKDTFQKIVQIDLPEKSGISLLVLIIGLAVIIALGALVFVIFRNKKREVQAKEQELRAVSQREAEEKQRRIIAEKEAEHAAQESEKIQEVVRGIAREKQRVCKKCGRVMDPRWNECLFCKQEDARQQALSRKDVPVYKQTRLRFVSGSKTGQVITLPGYGELTIGAESGNDLVFLDRTVSGNHAKITINENRYFIEDLESSNGTHIDSQRLTSYFLHPLIDGQRIKMGEVVAIFEAE